MRSVFSMTINYFWVYILHFRKIINTEKSVSKAKALRKYRVPTALMFARPFAGTMFATGICWADIICRMPPRAPGAAGPRFRDRHFLDRLNELVTKFIMIIFDDNSSGLDPARLKSISSGASRGESITLLFMLHFLSSWLNKCVISWQFVVTYSRKQFIKFINHHRRSFHDVQIWLGSMIDMPLRGSCISSDQERREVADRRWALGESSLYLA